MVLNQRFLPLWSPTFDLYSWQQCCLLLQGGVCFALTIMVTLDFYGISCHASKLGISHRGKQQFCSISQFTDNVLLNLILHQGQQEANFGSPSDNRFCDSLSLSETPTIWQWTAAAESLCCVFAPASPLTQLLFTLLTLLTLLLCPQVSAPPG